MTAPRVEVEDLTKRHRDSRGIAGIDLAVGEGEIVGVLGDDGAGKTTLVRTLLGYLHPDRGEVRVLGFDMLRRSARRDAMNAVGYVPAQVGLPGGVTGRRLLEHWAELKPASAAIDLVDRFNVSLDRPVDGYDRTSRRRLAVVQAFMHEPRLAVLDEPTRDLDPPDRQALHRFLDEQADDGVAILLTGSDVAEIRRVCDRVAILREGRLVEVLGTAGLAERTGRIVRVRFREGAITRERLEGLRIGGVVDAERDPDGYLRLVVDGTVDLDELLDRLARMPLEDLEIREATMDEIFAFFYDEGELPGHRFEEVGEDA